MMMPGPSFGQPFPMAPMHSPYMMAPRQQPWERPPQAQWSPQGRMQTQALPPPRFRAQEPDDPPPVPVAARPPAVLTMPSPEQLGVAPMAAAPQQGSGVWTDFHDRLDRLGVQSFHVERLPNGSQVTFLMQTDQPNRTHHVEARADSEAEAFHLALAKAEEWAGGRR